MASSFVLSMQERERATKIANIAVQLITARAFLSDSTAGEVVDSPPAAQAQAFVAELDKRLMLELIGRMGVDTLTEAVHESVPPKARASFDAVTTREGGLLPFLRKRIELVGVPTSSALFDDDTSFGCILGAVAIVAGVAVNGVAGGFAAVVGIVAVAAYC